MALRLLMLIPLLLTPQLPTASNARVSGVVINQATKEPLDGAEIRLKPDNGLAQTSRTDGNGQFTIENLPARSYKVTVSRSGFTTPESTAGPRYLTVRPDDDLKGLHFELAPTSAVSGRVTDPNGNPFSPAIVVALKMEYLNGRRVLLPGGLISTLLYVPFDPDPLATELTPELLSILDLSHQARTNEAGEYRIFGLEPGEYYLGIWQKGGENPTADLPPIYYPGVMDPSAAVPIRIGGNTDVPSVNIQVPSIERYSASYTVSSPTTPPFDCLRPEAPSLPVFEFFMLVQHAADFDVVHFANSRIAGRSTDPGNDSVTPIRLHSIGENRWETANLAPGSYELYHSSCQAFGIGLVGRLPFEITNHNVDAGTITIPANVILRGQVRNPGGVSVRLEDLFLRLRPSDWRGLNPGLAPNPTPIGRKKVNADGTFAFQLERSQPTGPLVFGTVAPGHYQIDLGGLPPDMYVASIKYGAKEVRDSGIDINAEDTDLLEITLGSPGGLIQGAVRDSKGNLVRDAKVALISQNPDIKSPLSPTTLTEQDGAFSFQGIAPGNYGIFAWTNVPTGAWDDTHFMQPLQSRGTKIRVEKGAKTNIDLRIIETN